VVPHCFFDNYITEQANGIRQEKKALNNTKGTYSHEK